MEDKKEYYQSIFKKYKELRDKTKLEVQDLGPGGSYKAQYIDLKELEEMEKTKNELEGYLKYLTEEDLRDLFDDSYFMDKALKILSDRRKEGF